MKKALNFMLSILALTLTVSITGCALDNSGSSRQTTWQDVEEALPAENGNETMRSIYAGVESLNFENNDQNRQLVKDITGKMGLLGSEHQAKLVELHAILTGGIAESGSPLTPGKANTILAEFSSMLTDTLAPGLAAAKESEAVSSAAAGKAGTRIVVSDGITREGMEGPDEEILPSAIVYSMNDSENNGLFNYLLARKVSGASVRFYYKHTYLGFIGIWRQIGGTLTTDGSGAVKLDRLAALLDEDCFPGPSQEQRDLQLRAEVTVGDGTVTDDKGIIRLLSADSALNHEVILTDHDNTLHETGGANSLADILDFLNTLKPEWPVVDDTASSEVSRWLDDNHDMIIISGMSEHMRDKTREQMALHFEGDDRRVPIIVKNDLTFADSEVFKAEAIKLLINLYGRSNVLAMAGDTARQDGYGALANDILYIPFQVHYRLNSTLLDTGGFGSIDPDSIAWTWSEVIAAVTGGIVSPKNVWLRNNAFMNIAHRGGGLLVPEDTLEAYRNAVAVGAHALEGDCHLTADGHLVVSHDATVDRCTDGTGPINEKTLMEIKALNAGYRFTTDSGSTYPYRQSGKEVRIPTVREVLDMLTYEMPHVPMILEIKSEKDRDIAVKRLLDLILEYDEEGSLINRLQLGAFNQEALDYMKDMGEAEPYNFSIVRAFATEGVLEFLLTPVSALTYPAYDFPGEVLALPWALATPGVMDKARRTGINVNIWTVNDRFQMIWLKNVMKVDGIMSDDPALLADVIANQ